MSRSRETLGELSAVKLALMAREVRASSEQVLRADPIAIVGMGCRVPGGVETPERFWELLRAGIDATRDVPADRWDGEAWLDPDVAAVGKSVTKRGGFLDRIDGFDAAYFGVLPREAERMDPQQRVFLEVAIEALDDAGLTRERLRGSRTGVFVASYHSDYAQMQYGDIDAIDARTLTGTLHSVLANRLSYFLDLRGPSLSIDTACSSSLVAIHLACQSLRFGESDIAVAGGVSLILAPELMVSMSKVGFMAADGRCKTFDSRADGFARGEGCGLIVLKRLSDAISDGDRVLAVVRGSAVNQDGHSTLLAAPHGPAQEALIREALASAQLSPERIGFVEAHGTGTALGDPIEVEAIAATLGRVPGAGACLLGSAKANVGHLEAAAGVTGLIKTVLALRHEAIPPQVHFRELNPHINLAGTRLVVPREMTPWPRVSSPRCAGISSFGVGGTNAHVIVEEAPEFPSEPEDAGAGVHVLPLSAQTPTALMELARSWNRFLDATAESITDVCFTAAQRRTHYGHRLAVVGHSKEELATRLLDHLDGAAVPGVLSASRVAAETPRIAFVFSGQGPQWYAMGRELSQTEPVFHDALAECDALLKPLSGWSLLEELGRTEQQSRLNETEVAQPALFALQVGLAALWKSWGVQPAAVVGHSVGEIAALHVAGALDLATAVRVVWHRGRIMQQATGLGRMASVALTETEAAELLRPYGEKLSIGALNSPRGTVLSGAADALARVLEELSRRDVAHRMLPVQYAFHSVQMAPFQARLEAELRGLQATEPAINVYSTVTGAQIRGSVISAAYFGRNVREPVRFAKAMDALLDDGCDVIVEIAPHPVLGSAIAECVSARDASPAIVTSLRRGRPELETMLQACAAVHVNGGEIDWAVVQSPGQVVSLPAYPWQRKRYWIRKRPVVASESRRAGGVHPLLGTRMSAAGLDQQIYQGSSDAGQAWLEDHRIFGRLLLPAAAVLEMFTSAASHALNAADVQLEGFAMHAPLFLPEADAGAPARWQVSVSSPHDGRVDLQFYQATVSSSEVEPVWRSIASASATALAGAVVSVPAAPASAVSVPHEAFYSRFNELGVAFGPTFQCLSALVRSSGFAAGQAELPRQLNDVTNDFLLHPVLIDAALQLCSVAVANASQGEVPAEVFLPLGADKVILRRGTSSRLRGRAAVELGATGDTFTANVILESEHGEGVLSLEGMRFARAVPEAFAAADRADDFVFDIGWQRTDATPSVRPSSAQGLWLVLADRSGVADQVTARLEALGGQYISVVPGDRYARMAERKWMVDPADASQFAQLLVQSGWATAEKPRGVLHCWSLDTATFDAAASNSAERDDLLATGSLLHLVQALTGQAVSARVPVWVITRGTQVVTANEPTGRLQPRGAGARGLASVAAIEHPELQLKAVDLDPSATSSDADAVLAQLFDDKAPNVAVRGADRFVPRLKRWRGKAPAAEAPRHLLRVARPGTFEGVELAEDTSIAVPAADQVRLRVLAAGLNFRDVLLALDMYPANPRPPLGAECVGEVVQVGASVTRFRKGARVFGYVSGSLGSEVNVSADFLSPLPDAISAEQGAGLSVAFLTAYYGLHNLAGLMPGERVLIHAAAGGVGLAAVQLAQRRGAEVFATAGSPEKRDFLRALGVAHIMDSRSLDFADEVLKKTGGQGVHVVLNSLAGEFIPASLRTLGRGGRFLELGKRDVWTPDAVARQRPDVRYWVYDLGSEAEADRSLLRPMFEDILAGLANGALRPLPVKVFPLSDVREAMRYMAQARHIGKIVLRVARERVHGELFSSDASYLITGGLGALGLETARWMVRKGARHLVLVSRRAPDGVAETVIRELEDHGAIVHCVAADASDRTAMLEVFQRIRSQGRPLRGIVHSAGVLNDGVLASQRWAKARTVLQGKAHGAWVLHELSREDALDFFVMYSAAGALLGAAGQGLYASANLQLDALAQARHGAGLPALSVNWGAWGGAGMAANAAAQGHDVWAARGLSKLDASVAFDSLERLLREDAVNAAVLRIDWSRFLAQLPESANRDFFADVAGTRGASAAAAPRSGAAASRTGFIEQVRALPSGQRREALQKHLSDRVLQVLGLDASTPIDPRAALKDLGLDSLMAVELRNTLNHSAPKPLPATLLFDYPTLDALTTCLAKAWGLEAATPTAPAAAATATLESAVDKMSDAEAEAMLLAELDALDAERAS